MRQADIKSGRTYINWPETATRTVTSIRGSIIYFSEVRHDWRPPRDRCRFERFAGWAKREGGSASTGAQDQTASAAVSGSGHPVAPREHDGEDRTDSDHQSARNS